MSKLIVVVFISLMTTYVLSGCVAPVVVGAAAGAGAVYDVTTGRISDNVDAPREVVVERFISAVKSRKGTILFASISEGSVKSEIGGKKVYLSVKNLTEKAVRFTIIGRKGYNMLPDKDIALEIYNEVIKGLK